MAEGPPPQPPAARPIAPGAEEALQLYQEGIVARQQGDWEKARALLLRSWTLQRHFQTAANLGEMELKLGQHREATEHLAYFLKEAPASTPDVDRARGQAMLDQARASLGTLQVATPPRDAETHVDGRKVENGSASSPVLVEVGSAAPAVKSTSSLPVDRREGAKRWIVVAGAAAAAVGVAMGTSFAVLSEGRRIERDEQRDATRGCLDRPDCEPYNAPERARGRFLTASLVSFIAAGAIGSGTLVYSLAMRRDDSGGRVKATASVGAGRAAGAIEVSW